MCWGVFRNFGFLNEEIACKEEIVFIYLFLFIYFFTLKGYRLREKKIMLEKLIDGETFLHINNLLFHILLWYSAWLTCVCVCVC